MFATKSRNLLKFYDKRSELRLKYSGLEWVTLSSDHLGILHLKPALVKVSVIVALKKSSKLSNTIFGRVMSRRTYRLIREK